MKKWGCADASGTCATGNMEPLLARVWLTDVHTQRFHWKSAFHYVVNNWIMVKSS